MNTPETVLAEVEAARTAGAPDAINKAVEGISDLFAAHTALLTEAQVEVFDEVLMRLVGDIEFKVRVALAERLADLRNAPRRITVTLASDDQIAVAGPVLERSPRLSEDELITFAATKGQDHLEAIARRKCVSEAVTDILLHRGSPRVVYTAAQNEGASFSNMGLCSLATKAAFDPGLHRAITTRRRGLGEQMASLIEMARAQVRYRLRPEISRPDRELLDGLLEHVGQQIVENGDRRTLLGDYTDAVRTVGQRMAQGPLNEAELLGCLVNSQLDEAFVTLAFVLGIPIEIVAHAFYAPTTTPLIVIVRSANLSKNALRLLLQAKLSRRPPEMLLKDAYATYESLSVDEAKRLLNSIVDRPAATAPTRN